VLFVDYMAEHLNPTGRAAIIVPEGIIFTSQTAYTQLRKLLVDDYLVAVVSLPAGVFNPYSGVKTSILILDKSLAKKIHTIAFFRVENDGFGLGAQRRAIDKNDLPSVAAALQAFRHSREHFSPMRAAYSREGGNPEEFDPNHYHNALVVEKTRIAANGDYNLSAERYRQNGAASSKHPFVTLGDVCEIYQPKTITQQDLKEDGAYPVYGANCVIGRYDQFNHEFPEVIVTCRGATCGTLNYSKAKSWITGNAMVFAPKTETLLKDYLFQILKYSDLSSTISGSAQPQITRQSIAPYQIPLPPLEVQKEIVAEIDGYQKVIDGARAVLDNYRPHIPIDPDWPTVELRDITLGKPQYGSGASKVNYDGVVRYIRITDLTDRGELKETDPVSPSTIEEDCFLQYDDLLIARSGSVGRTYLHQKKSGSFQYAGYLIRFCVDPAKALPTFVFQITQSPYWDDWIAQHSKTGTISNINAQEYSSFCLPLPPLVTQRAIVAEIEAEQALVAANRELIARFEKKIQVTLARVWGEVEPPSVDPHCRHPSRNGEGTMSGARPVNKTSRR